MEYADSCFLDGNYSKAVFFYEWLRNDDKTNDTLNLKIGLSYYKMKQIQLSNEFVSLIDNDYLNSQARNLEILNCIYIGELKNLFSNQYQWNDTNDSLMCLVYINAINNYDFDKAILICNQILDTNRNKEEEKIIEEIRLKLIQRKMVKKKSPLVAGILSMIIPGSGQIYSDHYWDGFQALFTLNILYYITDIAYKYDSNRRGPYINTISLAGITALFHFSNVLGAKKTAKYRNYKIDYEFSGSFRELYLIFYETRLIGTKDLFSNGKTSNHQMEATR